VAGARGREGGAWFFLSMLFIASLSVCSQPTPGYFTDDQTLDFLLQTQDGDGMKKVKRGLNSISTSGKSGLCVQPWVGHWEEYGLEAQSLPSENSSLEDG
jgi:hypothetical protein